MATKQNCWEHNNCGQQPHGHNAHKLRVCRATTETRLNDADRACWVVAETLCRGELQGVFSQKYATCRDCHYYDTFSVFLNFTKLW